jgi:hypothetical protein
LKIRGFGVWDSCSQFNQRKKGFHMRAIWLFAIGIVPVSVMAQANYVVFQNSVLMPPPDRLVRFGDGTPVTGTNYMAQLTVGLSADSLQPTTAAPSRFRIETTSQPGTWSGQNIVLPFAPGTVLTMQVRVWDSNFGTFEQARSVPGQAGVLVPFLWTVPNEAAPITDHYMLGFVGGITPIPCPEPNVFALALLAIPAAVLWRKCRR